jgi:glucuronate isomerase
VVLKNQLMKPFLGDEFLLAGETARDLYFGHAEKMPIIDYHSHLSPKLIADDHRFSSITEAWLYGDHYKWRAMRANGIDERFVTGQAADPEKFEKWAETVPYTLGNPLYHWTHLELERYFGVTRHLSPVTSSVIYEETTALLNTPAYSVRSLLEKMQVEVVCTTDDPLDSLEYHKQIAASGWKVKVLPTWRPDKVHAFANPEEWNGYVDRLSDLTGIKIKKYEDLMAALRIRHDYFHEQGCRLSDHGLEVFPQASGSLSVHDVDFVALRKGGTVTATNLAGLADRILLDLAKMDAEKGWVQQFHLGAQRSNNTRGLAELGPDTGFDSISDLPLAGAMAKFFDRLNTDRKLAKTILYNLNPAHNEVFASMAGNFQDGSVPGKMQWGSAWWFLDQKDGMEKQIRTLASFGLLSRFVGMLTDSRSFLSYPRHEYFRRILCNFIGELVDNGEWPNDPKWNGALVEGICYGNARRYFDFW